MLVGFETLAGTNGGDTLAFSSTCPDVGRGEEEEVKF